jgi:protein-tyrosine phosphatase
MAEAMFRELVKREGLEHEVHVDSAGTGDWHVGSRPHEGTRGILTKYNIDAEGLCARQIRESDLHDFHYIVGMDTSNVQNIEKLIKGNSTAHIVRLLDYVDEKQEKDIPDPYFTGDFEETYDLVKIGCTNLLNELRRNHNI